MILIIALIMLCIPAMLIMLISLAHNAAKKKQQASYTQQETIEFVVAGTSEKRKGNGQEKKPLEPTSSYN